jgi:hypothetical protein
MAAVAAAGMFQPCCVNNVKRTIASIGPAGINQRVTTKIHRLSCLDIASEIYLTIHLRMEKKRLAQCDSD